MKIKNFKKLKNGKYKLEFDNKEKLITYDNVILENNLLFNSSIDEDLLNKINKENNYYDVYNKVLKMVGTKLRSEKEIKDFLIKNGLSDNDLDKIITNLKNQKIIDDIKYTKAYIHDKIAFTNYGPNKIRNELLNYVDPSIIDEELELIEQSIFDEKVKKFILKKVNLNHKYSNAILKKKITDELYNLGFTNFNVDEFLIEDDSIIKKECLKLYEKLSKKYTGKELIIKLTQKLYQKGFSRESINEEIDKLNVSYE